MKDNKIISYYNSLDSFAQKKIDRQIVDLLTEKTESRNYCIKVCQKCGSSSGFVKNGITRNGKQMYRCCDCHKRFTANHGQLTFYSHQDESKWKWEKIFELT